MKTTKRFVSALLTVLLLVGMLAATALSADAAVTPPSNLYWDGMTARWTAPSDENVQYYRLYLYHNGNEIVMDYTYSNETYLDFTPKIQAYGEGNYTFSVATATGNSNEETSEFVYSSIYYYDGGTSEHHLIFYPFKYPTCTEAGDKGHYECSHCGKWFWDKDALYEITNYTECITEPLGHDWGPWTVVKEATADAEGQEQRVCQNDPDHVETRAIPKLAPSATAAPTQASTEATEATLAGTEPTVSPSAAETVSDQGAGAFLSFFGGSLLTVLLVALGIILVIVAVIIIIIVARKKSKKQNTPPAAPTQPPFNTSNSDPNRNDYHDPFDGE